MARSRAKTTVEVTLTGSAFSQPVGSSPVMIDLNSAASSLYFFSYSANLVFHSASKAAPAGMWRLQCLRKSQTVYKYQVNSSRMINRRKHNLGLHTA